MLRERADSGRNHRGRGGVSSMVMTSLGRPPASISCTSLQLTDSWCSLLRLREMGRVSIASPVAVVRIGEGEMEIVRSVRVNWSRTRLYDGLHRHDSRVGRASCS